MLFTVTDIYDYHRPSECGLRSYLRHRGVEEAPPGPFNEVLRRLGREHERRHFATLPEAADLSELPPDLKERRTLQAIRAKSPAIYQARFRASVELDGDLHEIVGVPDFLIQRGDGYVIRDSKLARRVDERYHREVALQLQLFGWLYERNLGWPAVALEVHAGNGDIIPVPYDGGGAALGFLRFIRSLRASPEEFYEPVGWAKCRGCGFFDRCWGRAVASGDAAILPPVSQALARKLQKRGVTTVPELVNAVGDARFEDLFYEKKKGERKLRNVAARILQSAEAHITGEPIRIAAPKLPDAANFGMFDLEGMPPHLDENDRIYLWGLKVFGQSPSGYRHAEAGFGPGGDQVGWGDFLHLASSLRDEYGDLPLIHWGSYEAAKLDLYIRRYGDPNGVAAWVSDRLVNLGDVFRECVVLPGPSLSLKVAEKHTEFIRALPDARGDWAMARYIEATETADVSGRATILKEIRAYNEEDLDATWAVLLWLRDPCWKSELSPSERCAGEGEGLRKNENRSV